MTTTASVVKEAARWFATWKRFTVAGRGAAAAAAAAAATATVRQRRVVTKGTCFTFCGEHENVVESPLSPPPSPTKTRRYHSHYGVGAVFIFPTDRRDNVWICRPRDNRCVPWLGFHVIKPCFSSLDDGRGKYIINIYLNVELPYTCVCVKRINSKHIITIPPQRVQQRLRRPLTEIKSETGMYGTYRYTWIRRRGKEKKQNKINDWNKLDNVSSETISAPGLLNGQGRCERDTRRVFRANFFIFFFFSSSFSSFVTAAHLNHTDAR